MFQDLLRGSRSDLYFDDGSSLTATALAGIGERIAAGLSELGLRPGDRLATWLPTGPAYTQVLAACAAGSYVCVNVNNKYSPGEAAQLIQRSGSLTVLTDRAADLTGLDSQRLRFIDGQELLDLAASVPTSNRAEPDDPFLVFTTSGTTSLPKMVLHTQRSIVEHAGEVASAFGLSAATPMLVALPLGGVFGLNSLTGALAGDCPIHLHSGFDAHRVAAAVEEHRIVAMHGSDDMFHRILESGRDLSSLQICGFGAFNASLEDIAERAETQAVELSGVYGMSEVQALFAFRDPAAPVAERRKAGGALSSNRSEVRVVDPDNGAMVAHGVDGEIQLRGPSLFAGYLAEGGDRVDPDLTAKAVNPDGWFSTGDLGRTEESGTFVFLTRIGDVLRLGGFLVSPAEIEEVILRFPGVSDAQVVAAASDAGTRPVAFVITQSAVDEARVIAHCRVSLALFKCPVRVVTVDSFPVTDGPNGVKIQKAKLRERAREELHRTT